jgi:hypothetical protein
MTLHLAMQGTQANVQGQVKLLVIAMKLVRESQSHHGSQSMLLEYLQAG